MGAAMVVQLLVWWLAAMAAAQDPDAKWESPKFEKPSDTTNFTYAEFTEAGPDSIIIGLNEHATPVIAIVNYAGPTVPRSVTSTDLNIVYEWSEVYGKYTMRVTADLDYDNRVDLESITWNVVIDGQDGSPTVSVYLVNINDNPPQFTNQQRSCSVKEHVGKDEDFVPTATDCSINVRDIDGDIDQTTITIKENGKESTTFTLSEVGTATETEKNYVIFLQERLDYEEYAVHTLDIQATDGVHTTQMTYIINVEDLPDTPPVWDNYLGSINIDEKTTEERTVKAHDGDISIGASISYNLTVTNPEYADLFEMGTTDGKLTIHEINRDELMQETFELVLMAYETDNVSMSVAQNVFVIVNDINDNSPTISATKKKISVDEGYSGSFDFGITIKDPDLADNARFTIALKDSKWSKAFLVVPGSGYQSSTANISVLDPKSLDYENEEWKTITLTVVATEVADVSHVDSMDFTIELNDINDEYPEFTSETFTAEVLESVAIDSYVITISATDEDAGDVITYRIVPSNQLVVDELSGNVTVAKALDYETTQQLTLQLTATDTANHPAYAELEVTVIDVNDETPAIETNPTITSVREYSDKGTYVATITATDPDTDASLELGIDWDNSFATKVGRRLQTDDQLLYKNSFQLEPVEGSGKEVTTNLTISGNPDLNWGDLDNIYLMLVVTDKNTDPQYVKNSKQTVQLTITIEDINNNDPIFNEVDSLTVIEEQSGYTIGFMTATDADGPGNNNITYSIEGAEEMYNDYVEINPKTGEMKTTRGIDCDEDGYDIVHLVVTASDGEHNTPKEISIAVTDMNDNGPVFGEFSTSVSIPERSDDDTVVVQIIATDKDRTAPFNTITYILQETDDNQLYFSVNNETGLLTVQLVGEKVLRREDRDTFTINILVRDNFISKLPDNSNTNQTTVTVTLQDINDNPPKFKLREEVEKDGCFVSDLGTITEAVKKGAEIGQVKAEDTDAGENGTISYFIESMTDSTGEALETLLFDVDETTGKVTAAIDLQNLWGNYEVLFKASDHGSPPLDGQISYTFCVIDLNDHDPEFEYPTNLTTIRLTDQQRVRRPLLDSAGNPVPDFKVIDDDDKSTGNGLVDVYITDGANDVFTIEPSTEDNTFQLLLIQSLTNVLQTSFELQLMAEDRGTPPRSSNITLYLKIITLTEQPPLFPTSEWTGSFSENETGLLETQQIINATDPNNEYLDPDEQQPIYYYIFDGDADLFQLDKITGILKLNGEPLDYEKAKSHTIYVVATNSDEPPENNPPKNDPGVLECLINVIDVNDMPPEFSEDLFAGGFTVESSIGTYILTVNATDPDTDDTVTFTRNGPIEASSSSLSKIKDNALIIDENGVVTLNFKPQDESLDGYFSFVVRARDSYIGEDEGHYADAEVQVYVISNIHRVTFQFLNNKTYVDTNTEQIAQIFSDVFKYTCRIDSTKQSADPSTGQALSDSTDVVAYFIDAAKNLPVERDVITRQFYEQETFIELQYRFGKELQLNLKSYQQIGNSDATNIEGILTIILIVVSAVLGTMVIVLFVAFFLRTKTLKRRLEALQELKFGSQNSGLNRVGVAVPNTNKHAVEGANPLWKTDAVMDYDNVSQGSGDSDMIGIEDNPEFQPSKNNSHFLDGPQPRRVTGILNKEFTFHPDDSDDTLKVENPYLSPDSVNEGKQPRRITETLNNNFILQYDTDVNDVNQKTQSVNPLANGSLSNTDNYEGNDNFSFKPTDSVPVTEL